MLAALATTAAYAEAPWGQPEQPYDALVRRLEAVEAQLAAEPASAAPGVEACGCLNLGDAPCECWPPAPKKPAYPTVKVNGFFHLDMGFYSQDAASTATLGDIDDGLGFRRSRLSASGQVTDATSYMMEYDFAQSQARFTDVWMQFAETPVGVLRIGRFRQPFG
ncbi:MAG: hypothetical protein KDH20_14560, partial [Rhodocyclaceae bacterium]|nr:hypothetical protein [Rhodocyclaceae bacterium]